MYSQRMLMRLGQFTLAQQTLQGTKPFLAALLVKLFSVMAAQVALFFCGLTFLQIRTTLLPTLSQAMVFDSIRISMSHCPVLRQ
jgi:hypothetical protein